MYVFVIYCEVCCTNDFLCTGNIKYILINSFQTMIWLTFTYADPLFELIFFEFELIKRVMYEWMEEAASYYDKNLTLGFHFAKVYVAYPWNDDARHKSPYEYESNNTLRYIVYIMLALRLAIIASFRILIYFSWWKQFQIIRFISISLFTFRLRYRINNSQLKNRMSDVFFMSYKRRIEYRSSLIISNY